jgi:imidazolonepropionase-like amidohydrolase
MRKGLLLVFAVLVLSLSALAQERPQAYVGARVIPINGAPIENGVIVVHRGKIVAVGARGSTTIPAGAETHDVTGKVIMPGLVDSHSHIGSPAGGDGSSPIQPDARVLDSFNPMDSSLKRARSGGVTTANVMSGSGHLLSGQTIYVKLRDANTTDELLVRDAQGNGMGGMKMANGTNSIRPTAPFPGTRAKSVALMREQLI